MAIPDTGSENNVISSEFANTLGYCKPDWESVSTDKSYSLEIKFVDCSVATTSGLINLLLSLFDPGYRASPVYQLVPSSTDNSGRTLPAGNGIPGLRAIISGSFYIIHGLRYDVILGQTILNTVDVYNQHEAKIFATPQNRLSAIRSLLHKKRKGE